MTAEGGGVIAVCGRTSMDTWIDATRQTRGLSKHAVAAVVAEALMTDLAVADHAAPYAHISAPNGCGGFAVCGVFPMKHRFNVYILVIRVREGMRLAYVKQVRYYSDTTPILLR